MERLPRHYDEAAPQLQLLMRRHASTVWAKDDLLKDLWIGLLLGVSF
jgi:hypothetical protein